VGEHLVLSEVMPRRGQPPYQGLNHSMVAVDGLDVTMEQLPRLAASMPAVAELLELVQDRPSQPE
jgi:hypothetical protein